MAASASHWSDDEIVVLLKDGIIPPHWDPFNNKISYSLLDKLFQCCFVVEGRNDDLIKNALVNLDTNIILPSNINNLKKKVSRFVSRSVNDQHAIVEILYDNSYSEFVGSECNKLGITKSFLEQLMKLGDNGDDNNNGCISTETFQSPFSSGVLFTNGIVLELLMFKERSNFTWLEFKKWLCFFCDKDFDDTDRIRKSVGSKLFRIHSMFQLKKKRKSIKKISKKHKKEEKKDIFIF